LAGGWRRFDFGRGFGGRGGDGVLGEEWCATDGRRQWLPQEDVLVEVNERLALGAQGVEAGRRGRRGVVERCGDGLEGQSQPVG
jgi:hypothetical protein